MKKRRSFSLSRKRALWGRLFVYPWVIGFLLFLMIPFVQTFRYSFNDVTPANMELHYIGLANFKKALTQDAEFIPTFIDTMRTTAVEVPLIIIFSLFMAVLLNQPFKGRTLVRCIFFMPVIITSGALLALIGADIATNMSGGSTGGASGGMPMLQAINFQQTFSSLRMGQGLSDLLALIIDKVYVIIWKSGVQIVIFLAGLQSISKSLYECASVEGATAWESFWKITFPMISPIMLVNIVYTLIDSFTDSSNKTLEYIYTVIYKNVDYGFSAAMSFIYFTVILAIAGIITFFMSKIVFYMND
ncbi:MAG: sugar ABC transporter permease [Clostridiales bacterium]|nr:sugar ABC transporter permease [Clostridiales bacterium]